MEALYRLSWLADKTGMVPVNWRAMETEELGSVYESLLELQPQLGDDGKTLVFASEAAEQKGNQRKTTGSYYTPDSLVQALLDTALDPVLDKTEAEADDPADGAAEAHRHRPRLRLGPFPAGRRPPHRHARGAHPRRGHAVAGGFPPRAARCRALAASTGSTATRWRWS